MNKENEISTCEFDIDKYEGANIEKCLSSFSVLKNRKMTKSAKVFFAKGVGLYEISNDGEKIKIGEVDGKVKVSKKIFKL